jgi:hypothetical protein
MFTKKLKKKKRTFCPTLLRKFLLVKFSWNFRKYLNRVLLYIQDTAGLVKVTGTTDRSYGLPISEPVESEDVYCSCFLKKRASHPVLDKYFKEK